MWERSASEDSPPRIIVVEVWQATLHFAAFLDRGAAIICMCKRILYSKTFFGSANLFRHCVHSSKRMYCTRQVLPTKQMFTTSIGTYTPSFPRNMPLYGIRWVENLWIIVQCDITTSLPKWTKVLFYCNVISSRARNLHVKGTVLGIDFLAELYMFAKCSQTFDMVARRSHIVPSGKLSKLTVPDVKAFSWIDAKTTFFPRAI